MKLANFAALDPNHADKALQRAGSLDAQIFQEFADDQAKIASH